jgi:hypothetical protein
MEVGGTTFVVVIAMVAIYFGVNMIQSAGCLTDTRRSWQNKNGTATHEEPSAPVRNGENQ